MGLFDIFKKPAAPRELPEIGESDPVCPYCSGLIEQMPAKKKKCPHCGNFIYVRTRPKDQVKILVTDKQVEIIEEQWSIVNGTHKEYLARKQKIEAERSRLAEIFGQAPSDNDVKWGLLGRECLEHALNGDWGVYRNTRLQMAELLWKESKLKESLSIYCSVCYLDLNGPRNTSGLKDHKLLQEFPPFSPKEAFLAPGIISRMARIIQKLSLDRENVFLIFQDAAGHDHRGLKLPVQPDDAWKSLRKVLFA